MEYPAIAMIESTHPDFTRVLSGTLAEGPSYVTWRTHGTADHLLIHTLSGAGRFGGEGGALDVGVGDSVLLRPGMRHDYRTVPGAGQWEIAFAHFHPRSDWMPLLDWPTVHGFIGRIQTSGEVHARVAAALARAAAARTGAFAGGELYALNGLEEALFWLDTQNPLKTRMDERVLRVAEHVGANLDTALSVERLAALVHLSPSRLSHLFAQQLDTTPQRFVERERMQVARQLLDLTSRPIADIARQVGYQDPMYFSRRFRQYSGSSPSEYRGVGRTAAP
jgi:AraC family transcriptional regulator of arabinose operon